MSKLLKLSAALLGYIAVFSPVAAHAQNDLLLGPGDVLRVTIASASALDRTMPVGPTGMISFPLLGEIAASGRTIADIEAEVAEKIAGTFYRQLAGNEEKLVVIRPEEIAIEAESYRPIYVDGAVNDPGEIPFRAGLTARQAVAATGGLISASFGSQEDLGLDVERVRAEYQSRVVDLAGAVIDLARVRAEINGLDAIDAKVLDGIDILPAMRQSLIDVANNRLVADQARLADEASYVQQSIDRAREDVMIALQQAEAAAEAYSAELVEVRRIEASGTLYSVERLAQAKRALLQANSQALNLRSNVAELRNDERDLVHKQDADIKDRQSDLLTSVNDLSLRIETLRIEVEGLRLQQQAMQIRMGVVTGGGQDLSSISISRIINGEVVNVDAAYDEQLQPGDVVTVSL